MKILIDGDACPVKMQTIAAARRFSLEVFVVIDSSHVFFDDYAKTVNVAQGKDSADLYIANSAKKGDVVITSDYGLAALVLAKNAEIVHPAGFYITAENIDDLLLERHLNQKARLAGQRFGKMKKRKTADDRKFSSALSDLLKKNCDA